MLVYTGLKFNFYDVAVMAIDEQVLREQVEKATRHIEHDSAITTQRRLNFEMSVKNLYQSFKDRERVPKIQGLLKECMTFLDDERCPSSQDLMKTCRLTRSGSGIDSVRHLKRQQEHRSQKALGKMLLQNMQLVVGKRRERGATPREWPAGVQRGP